MSLAGIVARAALRVARLPVAPASVALPLLQKSLQMGVQSSACPSTQMRWSSSSTRSASSSESSWSQMKSTFATILVDVDESGIATITLNRPEALNALNAQVMQEVVSACLFLDREHPTARVIVITGSGKAFAAGADIKEMAPVSYGEAYGRSLLNGWETLRAVRTPIIAAVNGYALGGGCELAMMADIIIASDKASFGQPEVQLGVIPGMGGTQRLVRAVGKSRAMELVLTGARIQASEAVRMGLASKA
ncbi:enoyl-CoA hydratase/isomerase, partial [Helicosporidium sp. ATCC 50920]